jgi:hypothetical protein
LRRLLAIVTLLLGMSALLAVSASSSPGKKPNPRHAKLTFSVSTQDNGSCGGPWANDTITRTFIVKLNTDGTYTLTRRDRGSFVTLNGVSPGACDPTGPHGHTVRDGVTGKLVGFLRGKVTGGTFNPDATCTGNDCGSTDVFLATFFGAGATFTCFEDSQACKFNYNYTAAHHQSLLFRHWQDKGKGAGSLLKERFHGDVADA